MRAAGTTAPLTSATLEALEPRALFSTAFVAVGLSDDRLGAGLHVFTDDALLDDRGGITGTRRMDSFGDLGDDRGVPWLHATFDDRGGLAGDFDDDRYRQHDRSGSSFLHGRGFPAGWFASFGDRALISQLQWFLERPNDATIADLNGAWAFNGLEFERQGPLLEEIEGLYGSADIDSGAFSGILNDRRHGQAQATPFSGTIASVTPSGVVRIGADNDFRAFLSRDKTVALWTDLNSDGEESLGIGVKRGGTFLPSQAAGVFRVGLVLADEVFDIHLGTSIVVIDLRLELRADGTFTASDLSGFDSGVNTARFSGTWTVQDGDRIVTRGMLGSLDWVLSSNGSTLLPQFITEPDGKVRPVSGLGTRALTGNPVLQTPSSAFVVVEDGRAIVYERGRDDVWRKADLAAKAGGPALIGRVESWTDRRDGLLYAAGRSSAGVILFRRAADGTWSFCDLTAEIPGAQPLGSGLTAFRDTAGHAYIGGVNSAGELVLYHDTDATGAGGRTWTFQNLSLAHLNKAGTPLPRLSGELVSYVTPWNGLNIAALDDTGHIQVVWTSPSLRGTWLLHDLTVLTGSSPVTGTLAVYLTPWGGVNIAGANAGGRLMTTWWAPGLTSWRQDDLTANAGGPTLVPGSMTTYVNPCGGLNVAGLDDSGHVHIYWWAPGMSRWVSSRMTDDSTPESDRPRDRLGAVVDDSGRATVFGQTGRARTIARTFEVDSLRWTTANLSLTAPEY